MGQNKKRRVANTLEKGNCKYACKKVKGASNISQKQADSDAKSSEFDSLCRS